MGRVSKAGLVADGTFHLVRLAPLSRGVVPALRVAQWSVNRGDVPGGYWGGDVDPEVFSVRMVDGRDCGVTEEETVGFCDRFLDGGGVHVDTEGRTFGAPPELEFEYSHVDDLLSFDG